MWTRTKRLMLRSESQQGLICEHLGSVCADKQCSRWSSETSDEGFFKLPKQVQLPGVSVGVCEAEGEIMLWSGSKKCISQEQFSYQNCWVCTVIHSKWWHSESFEITRACPFYLIVFPRSQLSERRSSGSSRRRRSRPASPWRKPKRSKRPKPSRRASGSTSTLPPCEDAQRRMCHFSVYASTGFTGTHVFKLHSFYLKRKKMQQTFLSASCQWDVTEYI